jgi:hypothetical protein
MAKNNIENNRGAGMTDMADIVCRDPQTYIPTTPSLTGCRISFFLVFVLNNF